VLRVDEPTVLVVLSADLVVACWKRVREWVVDEPTDLVVRECVVEEPTVLVVLSADLVIVGDGERK
jgi:hypothetical protein